MEKILERERLDGSQKSKFGSQASWLPSLLTMFKIATAVCPHYKAPSYNANSLMMQSIVAPEILTTWR